MAYYKRKYNKNQPTVLEVILVGIFKGLWYLLKLPFGKIQKRKGISADQRVQIINSRHQIENMIAAGSELELKQALLEADKLTDYVLKSKNYQGDTFADRLKSAEHDINSGLYNQIWQGHKVRNRLVHEQNAAVTKAELAKAANSLLTFIKQA